MYYEGVNVESNGLSAPGHRAARRAASKRMQDSESVGT